MSNLRELLFQKDQLESTTVDSKSGVGGDSGSAQLSGSEQKHLQSARVKKMPRLSLTQSNRVQQEAAQPREKKQNRAHQRIKSLIHTRLVESIDLNALTVVEESEPLEAAIERTIHALIAEENLPLNAEERVKIANEVLYETLGLGPLEPLLSDPDINDILVNGADDIWIDRDGKLEQTEIHFKDDGHLMHVINRIVARAGRRVDESSPIVDARLPDGSRVNAIIPPLALEGPTLSIRRFRPIPFIMEDLLERGALSEAMAEFLGYTVQARLNILISGGTSAGKTTLLNTLSSFIPGWERIVTIEDTAELRLQQSHVVRLESRPPNIEGQGAVTQRDLVKNALRMRPDRIIVGEVRGAEALDMLQAMNTGHEGSLTTVHANSTRDALSRLETLVLLAGIDLSQRSIREQIASAFDVVIQIKRMQDGRRRIVSISEITGLEGGTIAMQDIFHFKQEGLDTNRVVVGEHVPCGIRPFHESRFVESSIDLSTELFVAPDQKTQAGDADED